MKMQQIMWHAGDKVDVKVDYRAHRWANKNVLLQSTAPDTSTHKGDVCPFSTQTQLPDLIAK